MPTNEERRMKIISYNRKCIRQKRSMFANTGGWIFNEKNYIHILYFLTV